MLFSLNLSLRFYTSLKQLSSISKKCYNYKYDFFVVCIVYYSHYELDDFKKKHNITYLFKKIKKVRPVKILWMYNTYIQIQPTPIQHVECKFSKNLAWFCMEISRKFYQLVNCGAIKNVGSADTKSGGRSSFI